MGRAPQINGVVPLFRAVATHRLFAAIDLDADARRAIGDSQARVRRALSDAAGSIRWVQPDHIHLTLVFLAAIPDDQLGALIDACSTPIPQPPFSIGFGGIGVFPSRGAPRVVWLGVVEGAVEAARVQRLMSARVEALGIPTEHRVFRAHVTLGRWRDARPADAVRVQLLAKSARLKPSRDTREVRDTCELREGAPRTTAREVVLYESRLSPSGSTYTPVARAPLARRP